MMKKTIYKVIKKVFNFIGADIVRLTKTPYYSFMGLKNFSIRTIIDVGANEGQFAKIIEKDFLKANIYSFEPLPDVFVKLNEWALSKNEKVKVFNLALGDFEGEIEMLKHTDHSPSSSILKTTEICETFYPFTKNRCSITVKQTTLDRAVENLNIPLEREILIKLDVHNL